MREFVNLLEAMSYAVLLTENARAQFLMKTYGERMGKKWELEGPHEPPNVQSVVDSQPGETPADKVLGVILEADPSQKKMFSQWLVVQWLKNELRLEDLDRATDALTAFMEKQRSLEVKDINRYTLTTLRKAVQDHEQAVVQAQDADYDKAIKESRVLHNDATWLVVTPLTVFAARYFGRPTDWCTAYGDPKGRHPTRTENYFDHYDRQGPLFTVINRATGRRWQFHFETQQFMDESDSQIDLKSYFTEHPEVMHFIGENHFLKFADRIGIEHFSPQARRDLIAHNAAKYIKTLNDLKAVDEETANNPLFLGNVAEAVASGYRRPDQLDAKTYLAWLTPERMAILSRNLFAKVVATIEGLTPNDPSWMRIPEAIRSDDDFRDTLIIEKPEAFGWYLSDFSGDDSSLDTRALDLLAQRPEIIVGFPEHWRTPEAITICGTRCTGYKQLERLLPERSSWTPDVWQNYIRLCLNQAHAFRIADIPEEYRTEEATRRIVGKHLEDAATAGPTLTEESVLRIIKNNSNVYSFQTYRIVKYLPERLRTRRVVEAYMDAVKEVMSSPEGLAEVASWDKSVWTDDLVVRLINNGKIERFNEIPDALRSDRVVRAYLGLSSDYYYGNGRRVKRQVVPARYITDDVAREMLSKQHNVAQKMPPEKLTDDNILGAVELAPSMASHLAEDLPFVSERVAEHFMKLGVLPIAKMPKAMITAEAVMKRYETAVLFFEKEADSPSHIPPKVLTEDLAAWLVSQQPMSIQGIPDRLLTKSVLQNWLDALASISRDRHNHYLSYEYQQKRQKIEKQFARFKRSAFTSKAYADAMRLNLVSADTISKVPKNLFDKETAKALLGKNAKHFDKLPPELRDPEVLADALEVNHDLIAKIAPDQWTEPMAYGAMKGFAKHAALHSRDEDDNFRMGLRSIPRSVWSERVYDEAVGRVVRLSEVPEEMRKPVVVANAIDRAPVSSVRVLPDPAKWLNEHSGLLKNLQVQKRHVTEFLEKIERGGAVRTRKGFVNVRDLPRHPDWQAGDHEGASKGYTFAELPAGKVNKRVYLFDPDGNLVVNLWTEKDKVNGPKMWVRSGKYNNYQKSWLESEEAKKHRPALVMLARKSLSGFQMGDLNHLHIFNDGSRVFTEEQRSRKTVNGLEWSRAPYFEGGLHTCWINDKPILRVSTDYTKGMYGRGGNSKISHAEVIDVQACMANSPAILSYLTENIDQMGWSSDLRKIGFISKRDSTITVCRTKVGKAGKFDVWVGNENRFGIAGPKGIMAVATLRKNGNIDGMDISWEFRDGKSGDKLEEIMRKVGEYLHLHRDTTGFKLP